VIRGGGNVGPGDGEGVCAHGDKIGVEVKDAQGGGIESGVAGSVVGEVGALSAVPEGSGADEVRGA